MKMSTKSRYGLRALIDLIKNREDGPINLEDIANRQKISKGYLEQIFFIFKKMGIVRSIKGAKGGYFFNYDYINIKVYDVLVELEGDLNIIEYPLKTNVLRDCIRENLWDKIDEAIEQKLKSMTLEELTKKT
jgi:Rrf2 family protein